MGEFEANTSGEQFPPTAPNYKTESSPFENYIVQANTGNKKNTVLQGGVSDYEFKTNAQRQNGVTDNQVRNNVPLQGAVRDVEVRNNVPLQGAVRGSEIRTSVTDSGGIPTYCLRIEDQNNLDRDVFRSPFTGQVYHNVFIKQSDYSVVQRAKGAGTTEQINLYDNTGHLITPVYAAAVGGWFTVNFKPSTVVLNLYESPAINQRHNNIGSTAIPEGLKQKYSKYKPLIQGLLKQLR